MNTQASTMPGPHVVSPEARPKIVPASKVLYWSIRRELWEYRSVYLAPLAGACIFLFGFLVSALTLPRRITALASLNAAQQHSAIIMPYTFADLVIMGVAFFTGVFYCIDALSGERRDRSILFWKSLPVSDFITVIAKIIIPVIVIPLFSWAITVATHIVMLLLSSAVLLASGVSAGPLWKETSLFWSSLALLYHLMTVHALAYAPIYGWLLLASAWARRMAFLWAFLPPLAIYLVEKLAFNTSHFVDMLATVLSGGPEKFGMPMDEAPHFHVLTFLSNPGLWIGFAVAAVFLAAAMWVRRYREPN